ncbi:MAG: putative baseplate assembly protein [Deltaproteobacteria bacterium]|nr:putative baseplate assembly protein [Deltaproteobacteria bacterium]
MSRPPRPLFRASTTALARDDRQHLDFLAPDYAALLDLQRRLAEGENGLVTTDGEGDFARTLMESSALLGHLLALYQESNAQEAFLGTAQSDASLVRHARRLAYQPDAGLSATGFVALTVGEGLAGRVAAGLALASTPRGEVKAQDYETLEDLDVDASRNALLPVQARLPVRIQFDGSGRATFPLRAVGLGLEVGDLVLLIGPMPSRRFHLRVEGVRERTAEGFTVLEVGGGPPAVSFDLPPFVEDVPATHYRLLARPAARLHPFGWNAPSSHFPNGEVQTAGAYSPPVVNTGNIGDPPVFGFHPPHQSADVYLAEEPTSSLVDGWVLFDGGGGRQLFQVTLQNPAKVTLMRGEVIGIDQPLFDSDGVPLRNPDGTLQTVQRPQLAEASVSGAAAALRLRRLNNTVVSRSSLPFPGVFLAEWQVNVALVDSRPNPAPVSDPIELAGDLSGFEPGRLVAFNDLAGEVAQVFQVRSLRVQPAIAGPAVSEMTLQPLTPAPAGHTWTYGDLAVLGNVGRIAHGRGKEEILGGSDGVTPFLEFALKEPPLSQLPGAEGGEPAIEVRVGDVAWERVEDFYGSGPDDRHYRLVLDHEGQARVLFGNGKGGAIPSSGKRHIRALTKVGLGKDGNAEPLGVQRIKKAHPLIERALNPTPLIGGAEPAAAEDIRQQATRYIRTFDRAVSVEDYADLALLFPGVARTAASWSDGEGVELVAATADGTAPPIPALRAFLDRRRDTETPLRILSPQPIDLYLTIHLEHDPAYLPEIVKRAVRRVLHGEDREPPGLFTFAGRTFGQAAHRSEIYAAIEAVPGVTFSAVTRFAASPLPQARDVVLVTTAGWLRLLPENLEFVMTEGTA